MNYQLIIASVVIILLLYLSFKFRNNKEKFEGDLNIVLGNRETLHHPKIYNLKVFFGFMDHFMINYNKPGDHINGQIDEGKFILLNINNIMQTLNFLIYETEFNFYKRLLENSYYESYYLDNTDRYNGDNNNLLVYDHINKINILVSLSALKEIIQMRNNNDISLFNDIYDQTEIEIFDTYFMGPVKSLVNSIISIGNTTIYINYIRNLNGLR